MAHQRESEGPVKRWGRRGGPWRRRPRCALVVLVVAGLAPVGSLAGQEAAGAEAPREEASRSEGPDGRTSGRASGLIAEAPVFPPVVPPAAYRGAVEAGTRSSDGTPGSGYWQQRVDYRIRAELDPEEQRIRGEETVTYVNRSPDTLRSVRFHLYQNVFSAGVQRNRDVRLTGGMRLDGVEAAGEVAERVPPARFRRRLRRQVGRTGGAAPGEPLYGVGVGGHADAPARRGALRRPHPGGGGPGPAFSGRRSIQQRVEAVSRG